MIREKLKLVPTKPGCYQMKNSDGEIIYVGKAKNLKNRLSSYFIGSHDGKTQKLVSNIYDFEYIVTNTESESLVLELNLIKKYTPKYNILLKDDKSYPYIEITNSKSPQLNIVRNIKKTKSKLFGPYPNVYAARQTVNLLNRIYPLRKCERYPKAPCLYYHINQCLGYCVYKIEEEKINNMISEITRFLNGDHTVITKKIKEEIQFYSEKLQYEKCIELKEILDYIEVTLDRQKININDLQDRDIFGYNVKNGYMSVQVFFLRRGILVERKSDIFPMIEEDSEEITRYITMFYERNILPKEIMVQDETYISLLEDVLKTTVLSPKKGIKKQLIDMAINNAVLSLENEFELLSKNEEKIDNALKMLKEKLNLEKTEVIEIFDNSHLFGSYSVSGMVVFKDGIPDRNSYRKYKVSNELKDDYNIMKEVIYRRYFRVLKDNLKKPDLIIVDGGIIQINAAKEVLDSLGLDIKVIGLKKDDKHRTSTILDNEEIDIDKKSELFFLLTRMQDEVHRYTITYHRLVRSKGAFESLLDNVEGIGEVRKKELITRFGSVNKIKEATLDEIKTIIPEVVAVKLYAYLQQQL